MTATEQALKDAYDRLSAVLVELEAKRLAFEQERAAVLRAMVPVSQKDDALRKALAFVDTLEGADEKTQREVDDVALALRAAIGETFPGRPDCPADVAPEEIPL